MRGRARPIPRGCPVEGHAPSPHGFPVLRSISVYRHAVVNTPVARWGLIARGTAYSNRFPGPSGGGLPHLPARSATTLDVSRPAQRSLAITACRLAESPKRPVCLEGSDGFVTSTAAPIATGWSDPVAGWELHPLKTNTSRFTAHRHGVPITLRNSSVCHTGVSVVGRTALCLSFPCPEPRGVPRRSRWFHESPQMLDVRHPCCFARSFVLVVNREKCCAGHSNRPDESIEVAHQGNSSSVDSLDRCIRLESTACT